ncbi:ParB/RepB/Spo0J family partition protein [Geopseudomonas aromaticivorans]
MSLPPALSAETLDSRGFKIVPVGELHRGEFQPRDEEFNTQDLYRLGQSFLENDIGIIHPLLVRPRRTGDGYEIVAGERRWRAAKLVGLDRVPCTVRALSDLQCLQIGLVENAQRCDLTALEKAKTYKRAREEFGFTQEELAQTFELDRTTITNHERLLTLDPAVQAVLQAGRVSEAHGRRLIGLPAKLALTLARRVDEEKLSVRELERLVKQLKPAKVLDVKVDPDVTRFIEKLSQVSGYQIVLEQQGKKKDRGYMKIRYHSLDELQDLSRRIVRRG